MNSSPHDPFSPSPISPPIPPPLPDPFGHDLRPTSTNNAQTSHDGLVWRTMREALMMFVFNLVLGGVIGALGWKFLLSSDANSSEIAKLIKNPAVLFLMAVVFAPIVEELFCRGVPSLMLRGIWKARNWSEDARGNWYWIFGATSSFVFSVLHGAGDSAMQLPLPQLVMGFLLWRTAMNRGLRYSILMHATYNCVAVVLVLLAGNAVKTP